jgi:transposase-like protein
MHPLTYYEQIIKMPDKSDKFDLRLRIVQSAIDIGVKPAARLFDTTPKTVRKWLKRYKQERLSGLNELPRIPHNCPHRTPPALDQFTAREVRSGLMFLGFANEKSTSNACLFAQILCGHLKRCGVDMEKLKFQTDNGSEFIGCFRQDGTRDGFEATVAGFGSRHKRIPVRAWSYNSDVETVHRTIEDEFYDLENFEGIKDFHQRVASYQAWYNLVRTNMNKEHKSPWQIIKELRKDMSLELARLPPLMLDWLGPDYITRDELSLRGYDVPCYPFQRKKRPKP